MTPNRAEEIASRLIAIQRMRIAEAEAQLDLEKRKLFWTESLAGDLVQVLEELGLNKPKATAEPEKSSTHLQPPEPLPSISANASRAFTLKNPRKLREQEILEYVYRVDVDFTPKALKALIEKQCGYLVDLRSLQASLRRMASIKKGIVQAIKGNRGKETLYQRTI